jgi:PhnB protein
MKESSQTFFAPELIIQSGLTELDFYKQAFGAVELRRFSNDDGTIHVSEMSIDGNIFHFHEERPAKGHLTPAQAKGVTTIIGLFVPDVDAVIARAEAAGAKISSPAQDYEYGYRQGSLMDPYGHTWQIQKAI